MSRKSIVMLTGSHLSNNPRGVKEADTLSAAGFDVEVLGWSSDARRAVEDRAILQGRPWRFTPVVNLLEDSRVTRSRWLCWRIERRIAHRIAEVTGVETAGQLGGWRRPLLAAARQRQADLFIAHSAVTLWAAEQLHHEGRRVGVDMEDWFSREHLSKFPSRLVAGLERRLLGACAHTTCTSEAMSQAMAADFQCRPPLPLYNAFHWAERDRLDGALRDRRDRSRMSLHWYSQTIGPGRGLEELFLALPQLRGELEIHLRGTLGSAGRDWLNGLIPDAWRERVQVHPQVPNAELLSRIAEHDVGLAGETKHTRNHDLTVSNKILQYLLAGLAVVASDTAGQREVGARVPAAILLYRSDDPASLADQLNRLLAEPERVARAKTAALAGAREHFSWEPLAPRLVESVAAALEGGTA
jgi:glycosyltransferase involved in cell wall biosynthesis